MTIDQVAGHTNRPQARPHRFIERTPGLFLVGSKRGRRRLEAPAQGGRVVALMGNHESMNLLADYRDVSDETFATFATEESEELREQAYKSWVQWMRDLARTRGQVPPKLNKDKKQAWMLEHPPGYINRWAKPILRAPYRRSGH